MLACWKAARSEGTRIFRVHPVSVIGARVIAMAEKPMSSGQWAR